MNYLAHLYLSGSDPDILFGNFIADHVKGGNLQKYAEGVRNGIMLHRFIDFTTDSNQIAAEGKLILRSYVSKYAPVALDVIFDHFLAKHWDNYAPLPLKDFTSNIYTLLDAREHEMPERIAQMYFYMKRDHWLLAYADLKGVQTALSGMSRRAAGREILMKSTDALEEHYSEFEDVFNRFFPELERLVKGKS